MTYSEIITALKRMKVETNSLTCFGCGREHNCSIHGCAIMREAAQAIEALTVEEHINTQAYGAWISVKDRLPEVEKRVLVCIVRHSKYTSKDYTLVTCAIYEDGKVNVEDSCWMCEDGDYDEEADVTYVPRGWYEFHEYGNTEEDGIGLIGGDPYLIEEVTHWMPLPEPPKEV